MKDEIEALELFLVQIASDGLADVGLDEGEMRVVGEMLEIDMTASDEIVDADDGGAKFQELVDQMGADKAGSAGNEDSFV